MALPESADRGRAVPGTTRLALKDLLCIRTQWAGACLGSQHQSWASFGLEGLTEVSRANPVGLESYKEKAQWGPGQISSGFCWFPCGQETGQQGGFLPCMWPNWVQYWYPIDLQAPPGVIPECRTRGRPKHCLVGKKTKVDTVGHPCANVGLRPSFIQLTCHQAPHHDTVGIDSPL